MSRRIDDQSTSCAIQKLPMEVLRELLLQYCANQDAVSCMRLNRNTCALVCQHVIRPGDAWTLRWEAYLHAMFVVGATKLWPCVRTIPNVVSRTCRGCSKYTERKVFGTPVCEKCTLDRTKKWRMVPYSALRLQGVCVRGKRFHRGRRDRLFFAIEVYD